MIVRIFTNTDTESNTINVYKEFIDIISNFIQEINSVEIKPYWKCSDMYIIETDIKLTCTTNEIQFQEFLHKISDNWQFFGTPVDEALASINDYACSYMLNGINMINIFY